MSPEESRELIELSVVDAAARIQRGTLSPVRYTEALLARMDQVESRVQAWVTVDREAVLAEAKGRAKPKQRPDISGDPSTAFQLA